MEQMRPGGIETLQPLPQHIEIIEQPKAPALGSDDEVVVLERQISDGHLRQIELERTPIRTVVRTHIQTELRAGVQQARRVAVGTDDAGEMPAVDALGEGAPSGAVVVGVIQIRRVVARLVPGGCDVEAALAVRIDLDAVDQCVGRHPLGRDVLPRGTGIAGDVDEAVVRTGPNQAGLARRFRSGKNRRVVFHAGVVLGDRPARRYELLGLAAGEIGRDDVPRCAAVGGAVHELRARVKVLRVMR